MLSSVFIFLAYTQPTKIRLLFWVMFSENKNSLVQDQYLVPWPDKLYFAIDLPNASATSTALTWRFLSLSPPRSPGIQDSPRMSPAKKKV